ncbi:MAG: hypothetical protein JOZ45_16900 [Acidobacteriaceae bacterium]|nr:hypothetical protein [Acidobacteriaceae bacterium]
MLTTNLPFSEWTQVIPKPTLSQYLLIRPTNPSQLLLQLGDPFFR